MEFVEGEQLFKRALPMVKRFAALKVRAVSANIPIIYVNDNFGHWRSDLKRQMSHALLDGFRGDQLHVCAGCS
jgi:hypothetical protein